MSDRGYGRAERNRNVGGRMCRCAPENRPCRHLAAWRPTGSVWPERETERPNLCNGSNRETDISCGLTDVNTSRTEDGKSSGNIEHWTANRGRDVDTAAEEIERRREASPEPGASVHFSDGIEPCEKILDDAKLFLGFVKKVNGHMRRRPAGAYFYEYPTEGPWPPQAFISPRMVCRSPNVPFPDPAARLKNFSAEGSKGSLLKQSEGFAMGTEKGDAAGQAYTYKTEAGGLRFGARTLREMLESVGNQPTTLEHARRKNAAHGREAIEGALGKCEVVMAKRHVGK